MKNPEISIVRSITYNEFINITSQDSLWMKKLDEKITKDYNFIMGYFSVPYVYSGYIMDGKYSVTSSISYNDTQNEVLGIKRALVIKVDDSEITKY